MNGVKKIWIEPLLKSDYEIRTEFKTDNEEIFACNFCIKKSIVKKWILIIL